MTAPGTADTICDLASVICGFLVAVGEYLRTRRPEIFRDAKLREHFHRRMFLGYDFDNTLLRIGSMNMPLNGVDTAESEMFFASLQHHGFTGAL